MRNPIIKITALLSALLLSAASLTACGKAEAPAETTAWTETTEADSTAVLTTAEPETETATEAAAEETTAPEETTEAAPETTEAEKTTEEDSGAPKTKAEVIEYLNTAVNAVKSKKAGFKKVYKRDASGDISGLPDWLKGVIRKNETSTQQKGKSSDDVFPAAGYGWSSHLRESDVKSYTIKEDGKYYVIHVDLGTEKNPEPGEASSYGRCMSVVTVASAEDIPGISSVSMDYHNGYVDAKIDSETGKVVECAFSAAADVSASVAILGDISVSNIVSTETFSDFVW